MLWSPASVTAELRPDVVSRAGSQHAQQCSFSFPSLAAPRRGRDGPFRRQCIGTALRPREGSFLIQLLRAQVSPSRESVAILGETVDRIHTPLQLVLQTECSHRSDQDPGGEPVFEIVLERARDTGPLAKRK